MISPSLGSRKRTASTRSKPKLKMSLEAIKYERGRLEILDQLHLPASHIFITLNDTKDAWDAIKKMQVRGAPAIAIVGCLSLAVELLKDDFDNIPSLVNFIVERLEYLVTSRPTAVNMKEAAVRFSDLVKEQAKEITNVKELRNLMIEEFELMYEDDIATNKAMGQFGAQHILANTGKSKVNILTHCNTGSLATAGHGTALGVIRTLQENGNLDHAFCTETRPYNQGARLTAYELVYEQIPATLICDSMVSMVLKDKQISAIVVGADRVVKNGDTANKIGTYQIAISAKHHNIPFYIACPITTFDPHLASGEDIIIEERHAQEMTHVKGVEIAAPGINCFNPAFDVTPAELITGGIITEYGVFPADQLYQSLRNLDISCLNTLPRSKSKAKFQMHK